MHTQKEFYEPSSFIYIEDNKSSDFMNCLPAAVMPLARIVQLYVQRSTVQTYFYIP